MKENIKTYISSNSRNISLYKRKFARFLNIVNDITEAKLVIMPIETHKSTIQIADTEYAVKNELEIVYIPSDVILDDKLNLNSFFIGRKGEK